MDAALALVATVLFGALGVVMLLRTRFFVARYVRATTAQAPRRERPTEEDLARVKPGDVFFWRFMGVLTLAFVCFFFVKAGLHLLDGA